MTSFFNSSSYYYVNASISNAPYWLSDTYTDGGPPETLSFTQTSYSSNNWQFFYQDSIYLIRNYDYQLSYQLGVNTTTSPPLPALLPASGELTQQWNITKLDDGTFRMTNLETGSSQALSLDGSSQLVMSDVQSAESWIIDSNPGAPAVPQSMQQSVLLQAPSTTSVSSSSASMTGTTATASITPTTSPSSTSTASKGISGGAIGGIVAGVIIAVLIAIGVLFFMRRRKTRAAIHEVGSTEPTESKILHEIQSQPVYETDSSRDLLKTSSRVAELSS